MTKLTNEQLNQILEEWGLHKETYTSRRYGSGHINDTYCIADRKEPDTCKYILQRINHAVFTNPEHVMDNIVGVTSYLAEIIKAEDGDPMRETLNIIPTIKGENYLKKVFHHSENGNTENVTYWRLYYYVKNSMDFQKSPSLEIFSESGYSFGRFARRLIDYPVATLYETIENFHDTPKRLADFKKVVEADQQGRVKNCQAEIDFILKREKDCAVLQNLLAKKELPLRVTHNDTKLNNVLFDNKTGKGICIVDLDTVMPGLLAHDYGDSIRFGASTALEDEQDLEKVHFSLELFEVYTKAYLEEVGSVMTEKELETLAWGARLMTLECGMRFLMDYLQGDIYFKIDREKHNLERARTQIKLVSEMEEHFSQMQHVIMQSAQLKV